MSRCQVPAAFLFFFITFRKSVGFSFPLPISTIVPTIARTIFLRNLSGRNGKLSSFSFCSQFAWIDFANIGFIVLQFFKNFSKSEYSNPDFCTLHSIFSTSRGFRQCCQANFSENGFFLKKYNIHNVLYVVSNLA